MLYVFIQIKLHDQKRKKKECQIQIALGKLRQEDGKFEVSFYYVVRGAF